MKRTPDEGLEGNKRVFLQVVRMPGLKCPTYLRITMCTRRIIMTVVMMLLLLP